MRHLILFLYWIAAAVLLALVMMSFGYGFGHALFLATSLLPGMLCAKFCLPLAAKTACRKSVTIVCVVCGVLLVEWMVLLLADTYTQKGAFGERDYPALFSNPVFILILLMAFVIPGELLERYLKARAPRDEKLAFISDRCKVSLSESEILYVESNDSEVLLHTSGGACYRTKTRISQWQRLLDERFVRIHRAYLVNADRVTGCGAGYVLIGEQRLVVSRKYKEDIAVRFGHLRKLGAPPDAGGLHQGQSQGKPRGGDRESQPSDQFLQGAQVEKGL